MTPFTENSREFSLKTCQDVSQENSPEDSWETSWGERAVLLEKGRLGA
jgi:hypothetical protein